MLLNKNKSIEQQTNNGKKTGGKKRTKIFNIKFTMEK